MTTSNVFVVDDDTSVRNGVARLLRSAAYQVETFESAEGFLQHHLLNAGPGCLVLDIQMPGFTGLDLQERLLRANSSIGIVFITGHGDIPTSVRAVKNGAVDFLSKPFDQDELLSAVARALEASMRRHSTQQEFDAINCRIQALTHREREVLCLVVTGLLNKQIADRIGTTEKTVKVHRGRVMEKMHVRSLAELVQLSVKAGILPDASSSIRSGPSSMGVSADRARTDVAIEPVRPPTPMLARERS